MNYSSLARSYHPLLYKPELSRVLNRFFDTDKYSGYSKRLLHKTINDVLLKNHRGEDLYKYRLARQFYAKKVVGAFEVPVNHSRLDFLAISENTRSFEIKSVRDTLSRLEKQLLDYSAVFEYNYIVTDRKHIRQVLETSAEGYGIWSFEGNVQKEVRAPHKTAELDPEAQLSLLNKKELRLAFEIDNRAEILSTFPSTVVNERFKGLLKRRYHERWTFIKAHKELILPIDLQFFFNTNIKPGLIYEA